MQTVTQPPNSLQKNNKNNISINVLNVFIETNL